MKQNNFLSAVVAVISLIVGTLIIIFSVNFFTTSQQFIKTSIKAEGKVVDIVRNIGQRNTIIYAPKVSFVANNGKEYVFTSPVRSSISYYHSGDNLKVLYDPQNPQNARIDTFFGTWGEVVLPFFVGLVFVIIGVGVIIWLVRKISHP